MRDAEMAALVRAYDWARTPLGPMDAWPQSLKTVVDTMLSSRFPMWMVWGPELTSLYNDAYGRGTLGGKHPWALGKPFREVWPEVWPELEPLVRSAIQDGVPVSDRALPLTLERNGYPEETYHTFSYSPLRDDDGAIAGLLGVIAEVTEQVVNERRFATLRELASALVPTRTERDVLAAVERSLGTGSSDLPFTLVYLFDECGGERPARPSARLACASGVALDDPAVPGLIASMDRVPDAGGFEVGGAGGMCAVDGILAGETLVVADVARGGEQVHVIEAGHPPARAAIAALTRQGDERPVGFLVAGINPHREFDEAYRGFVGLVAGQAAASLANARAHEEEQRSAWERERLLATIERKRERLHELLARAPAAIAVLQGPEHVFESANAHYLELVGERRGLVGRKLRDALPELEGQGIFQLFDHVYRTGETYLGEELPVWLGSGGDDAREEHFFNLVLQAVRDADHRVSGVFVHAVDVTGQVRARREAEEANRAKSDFLAAMSHELRTPLNAIAGHAQLIEMGVHGPVTDAQVDALRRIARAQRHLLGLINDILNLAKLERGRVEYDMKVVSLQEVVTQVIPIIEPQVASQGLTLDVRIGDGLPQRASTPAWADPDKLTQVLLNLLSNAVKFTPRGGQVTVEVADRADGTGDGDVVFLRVRDTGPGIPPDRLGTIFEPFVQVRTGHTRTQEGTGLGLAISRDLARGMGGDLRVRSEPGEGASFTITLRRGGPDGNA